MRKYAINIAVITAIVLTAGISLYGAYATKPAEQVAKEAATFESLIGAIDATRSTGDDDNAAETDDLVVRSYLVESALADMASRKRDVNYLTKNASSADDVRHRKELLAKLNEDYKTLGSRTGEDRIPNIIACVRTVANAYEHGFVGPWDDHFPDCRIAMTNHRGTL